MLGVPLDAEPPVASFLKSMLIGGGPVKAVVRTERRARAQRVDSNALFICAFTRRIVGLVVDCVPVARFACVWFVV